MNLAPLAMTTDPDLISRLADRAAQWRNQQDDATLAQIEARTLAHDRKVEKRERKTRIMEARRNKAQRQQFEAGE